MNASDLHDLGRFVQQVGVYDQALAEIKGGRKRSHWMWFIFPQFAGLGVSSTSQRYAIKSIEEARAYLAHPLLGRRLLECAEALLQVEGQTACEIFGAPDDRKLRSCATLFAHVSLEDSVFEELLAKYFSGEHDANTLSLIRIQQSS